MSIVAQGSAEKVIAPAPFPSHVSGAPRLASGLKTVKKKNKTNRLVCGPLRILRAWEDNIDYRCVIK